MIKVYKIKIGEKIYEVELEAVSEKEGEIIKNTSKNNKKEDSKNTQEELDNTQKQNTSKERISTEVRAPMQGLVVNMAVSVGQKVKAGETLVVFEAMKMENPVVAPKDGTVVGVYVSKGDTIESGMLLVSLS